MLTVTGVSKTFKGFTAVRNVSLEAQAGEVLGIIGPNGAGKSTLVNLVSGYHSPDTGTIQLNGTDITGAEAHVVSRLGLYRTFQVPRVVERLTVVDNVALAAPDRRDMGVRALLTPRRRRRASLDNYERARACLAELGLDTYATSPGGVLSGGQRKLLDLACAMMRDPQVLIVDEPTAGVSPVMIEPFVRLLRELAAKGVAVVVIEHNMNFLLQIATRLFVMANGEKLAEGNPFDVIAHGAVKSAYLGGFTASTEREATEIEKETE